MSVLERVVQLKLPEEDEDVTSQCTSPTPSNPQQQQQPELALSTDSEENIYEVLDWSS